MNILIIDDNAEFASLLELDLCEHFPDGNTLVALSSEIAKFHILSEKWDLAFVDIMLGAQDGISFVIDLINNHRGENLPLFVGMTSYPDEVLRYEGMVHGLQGIYDKNGMDPAMIVSSLLEV